MGYLSINCDGSGANVGIPTCIIESKKFLGFIITPKNFEIPLSELVKSEALFLAYLQNKTMETEPLNRFYPVMGIRTFTDNSEATVVENGGYGTPKTVRDGKYSFTIEHEGGGLCLSNKLRKFNNKNFSIFLINDEGLLIGKKTTTGLKSISLDRLYQDPHKFNDGAATAKYMTQITITDAADLNENMGFFKFNDSNLASDILGLIDLTLVQIVDAGAATIKVKVIEKGCSGANIGAKFNGELDVVGAFVSNRTLTAVSYDAVTESFVLTVATTWAAADTIALVNPTALAVLLVGGYPSNGYESDTLTVAATV
jgi:hypothetical protein